MCHDHVSQPILRPGSICVRYMLTTLFPVDLPVPPIDQDSPRWQRSVVAVDRDQPVGVGWISLDPVTDTYFVEIHVAVDHRRRGVGTALFEAVCGRADQPFPVCARVMSSQPWRREIRRIARLRGARPVPGAVDRSDERAGKGVGRPAAAAVRVPHPVDGGGGGRAGD